MHVVNTTTIEDYIARLNVDREEVTRLFRDLFIRVASFFRDTDTFQTLASKVIPTLLEGLSLERRQRFLSFSHGTFSVAKEARERCTFSLHNLIRDPPFSIMSLVSCRNLLIYMDTNLQNWVIPVFRYSLVPKGILLLGSSESVAQHPSLFDTVDKAARIFRRLPGRSPELELQWRRTAHASENPATLPPGRPTSVASTVSVPRKRSPFGAL